jgi:hypothetical protein
MDANTTKGVKGIDKSPFLRIAFDMWHSQVANLLSKTLQFSYVGYKYVIDFF